MLKNILYSLYLILVFYPLFCIITIITAILTGVGCIVGLERIFSYYPGVLWGKSTVFLSLCPLTIEGREYIPKDRLCVITSNHQSSFDIYLLYGYLGVPFKWVLRASLARIPFVGWACRKAGFIFVDASTNEGVNSVIVQAEEALRQNYHIVIFPEGTRTLDGEVKKFKKGAFKMAIDSRSLVLPVSISGAFEVQPKGCNWIHWHPLKLRVHPPIDPETYAPGVKGLVALSADCRNAIISGVEK